MNDACPPIFFWAESYPSIRSLESDRDKEHEETRQIGRVFDAYSEPFCRNTAETAHSEVGTKQLRRFLDCYGCGVVSAATSGCGCIDGGGASCKIDK
ncbi:hypothetical protein ACLOJK_033129 [Asimina triloba]